jgi:hypothetical protein
MSLSPELVTKLRAAGIAEAIDTLLVTAGVETEADLASLNLTQLKDAGINPVVSNKLLAAFAPVAAKPVLTDLNAEIPDGAQPSTAQVNTFANSLGMDPNMLTMFMLSGASADAGSAMDISSMIPISQIVAGYNPKIRNMFLMIMGQFEARLGAPIVVINGDGSVNKGLTVEYIEGLEEGRDLAENNVYYDADANPYEIISVGVDAQSIYDADPLDSTKALQKNGQGIGRINWHDVSLEVRQVAYYAVKTGEVNPNDNAVMNQLRDKVKPGASRLIFSGMAPKAIASFNEANRTGSLPTLRVMLSRSPRRKEAMPRRRMGVARDVSGFAPAADYFDGKADQADGSGRHKSGRGGFA